MTPARLKELAHPHERHAHFTHEMVTELLAHIMEQAARVERLEDALRTIVIGKVQADNEHPLGQEFSMATRFFNIARAALTPTP